MESEIVYFAKRSFQTEGTSFIICLCQLSYPLKIKPHNGGKTVLLHLIAL